MSLRDSITPDEGRDPTLFKQPKREGEGDCDMLLEPELEQHFHPDSYGYRPGKSAHQRR